MHVVDAAKVLSAIESNAGNENDNEPHDIMQKKSQASLEKLNYAHKKQWKSLPKKI